MKSGEVISSLFKPERVANFTARVKRLQTAFGVLNDSAMAESILTSDKAPGSADPLIARASGRVIGHLCAESDRLWPDAITHWLQLAGDRPFWK